MDFNALHKQRKFIMIAAAVGLIGCFLPWITTPSFGGFGGGSVNGLHRGGLLVFAGMIGAGVLAFMGDQKANLSKNSWLIVLGIGALSILLCILTMINKFGAGSLGGFVKVGFGLFISLAGAAGVTAAAYLFKNPKDDLRQSLNSMTQDVKNKLDGDPNT